MSEFNFELIKCSRCGVTTALGEGHCRSCGQELKQRNSMEAPLYMVGAAVALVVGLGMLAILGRLLNIAEIMGIGLLALGGVISLASSIWLIVNAFREDPIWGIACIFIPLAQFVFLFVHPQRAVKPFILYVVAILFIGVGLTLAGGLALG